VGEGPGQREAQMTGREVPFRTTSKNRRIRYFKISKKSLAIVIGGIGGKNGG